MPRRPRSTILDYLVGALNPALIMAMVGCLASMLLEVTYVGEFRGRLQWTLSWFVFGIVLISRIAIVQGGARARVFGVALGGAVGLVTLTFLGFRPIVWMIMALVWWSTHQLTRDSTLLDEDLELTGEGLLQRSGLEGSGVAWSGRPTLTEGDEPLDSGHDRAPKVEAIPSSSSRAWPWNPFRLGRRGAEDRRPHAPGTWVVYFLLATLPLFGLGQALVPSTEAHRRARLFALLCGYVVSGMGLLLTTSFLGLRRYLRARNLQMPAAMAGVWLGLGTFVIAGMLFLAALLPRPRAEGGLTALLADRSRSPQASRYAVMTDSPTRGVGRPGSPSEKPSSAPAPPKPGPGEPTSNGALQSDDVGAHRRPEGSGTRPGQGDRGQARAGQSRPAPGSSPASSLRGDGSQGGGEASSTAQGRSPRRPDQGRRGQGTGPDPGQDRGSQSGEGSTKPKGQDARPPQPSRSPGAQPPRESGPRGDHLGARTPSGDAAGARESSEPASASTSTRAQDPPGLPPRPRWAASATPILKWLVAVLLAIGAGVLLWRYGSSLLDILRDLIQALRDLWSGLWSGIARGPRPPTPSRAAPAARPQPFSAFSDPFRTGLADRSRPEDLIRYTFQALEAWATERDLSRRPQETPLEFADRIGPVVPEITEAIRRLATLYGAVAYGPGLSDPAVLPTLRRVWDGLSTPSTAITVP